MASVGRVGTSLVEVDDDVHLNIGEFIFFFTMNTPINI